MKKLLALLLSLAMLFALAACGGGAPAEDAGTPDDSQTEQQPEDGGGESGGDAIDLSDYLHTRTGRFYNQFKNGEMLMKYEMTYEGQTSTMTTATSGDKTYSETTSGGMTTKTIMDGEYMYTIDDSNKMIMKMALQATSQEMADTFLEESDVDMGKLQTGTRTVDGKSYDTEEWQVDGAKSILCFDGDTLVYMIGEYEGTESVMKVLEFSDKVDSSFFELPTGYQEVSI